MLVLSHRAPATVRACHSGLVAKPRQDGEDEPMQQRHHQCHEHAGEDDVAQEMAAFAHADKADEAAGEHCGAHHERAPPPRQ